MDTARNVLIRLMQCRISKDIPAKIAAITMDTSSSSHTPSLESQVKYASQIKLLSVAAVHQSLLCGIVSLKNNSLFLTLNLGDTMSATVPWLCQSCGPGYYQGEASTFCSTFGCLAGQWLDESVTPHKCKKCSVKKCLQCKVDSNFCDAGMCQHGLFEKHDGSGNTIQCLAETDDVLYGPDYETWTLKPCAKSNCKISLH